MTRQAKNQDVGADERAALIDLIERARVLRQDVAAGIGVSAAHLTDLLAGRRTITPGRAEAIRRAVNNLRGGHEAQ